MSVQYVYTMQQLKKVWPGGKEILKDINLSFLPGAKIGVLGINGSGKSTLLKIIAGIDKDYSGDAWPADGFSIGYLPLEPQLDNKLNVLENVMSGLGEAKKLVDEGLKNILFSSDFFVGKYVKNDLSNKSKDEVFLNSGSSITQDCIDLPLNNSVPLDELKFSLPSFFPETRPGLVVLNP